MGYLSNGTDFTATSDWDASSTGYHITGWATASNGSAAYSVHQGISNSYITNNTGTVIHLYATWSN